MDISLEGIRMVEVGSDEEEQRRERRRIRLVGTAKLMTPFRRNTTLISHNFDS
jgi:hypothetical protein